MSRPFLVLELCQPARSITFHTSLTYGYSLNRVYKAWIAHKNTKTHRRTSSKNLAQNRSSSKNGFGLSVFLFLVFEATLPVLVNLR